THQNKAETPPDCRPSVTLSRRLRLERPHRGLPPLTSALQLQLPALPLCQAFSHS
ncbi:hypothetical protein KOW79_020379, partial [Hemibagrus wyckioides]